MSYDLKEQEKFKVGDKVKIIRAAGCGENDWENAWVSEMDEYVGKVATVEVLCGMGGIGLRCEEIDEDGEFRFPYFVLEKVEKEIPVASPTTDQFPHTCSYCGSPCWNGMEFKCSNGDCVTNKRKNLVK